MKNLLAALLLVALAACSSDPSPAPLDAQVVDATDVASELAPDVAVDAPRDTGPALDVLDAAVDATPDVATDAPSEAATDVTDAAVGDASPPSDGDGGAGPVTYDLGRMYGALEVHVLWLATCAEAGCTASVIDTAAGANCYADAMGVHFHANVNGLVPIGSDGGIGGSVSDGSRSTLDVRSDVRPIYNNAGQRRNAHVMFSMDAARGVDGATGIPGRTTTPDHADVWLLGCPVR